ncbi:MAG: hypothetical protein ACK5IP_12670 [Paracoccus sp. (in: a-proteobacteria)]
MTPSGVTGLPRSDMMKVRLSFGRASRAAQRLRKAICRRVAEIEGNVFKVMAVSGHHDLKQAQRYIDRYNRKAKADSAIESLSIGGKQKQGLANHPAGSSKNHTKL